MSKSIEERLQELERRVEGIPSWISSWQPVCIHGVTGISGFITGYFDVVGKGVVPTFCNEMIERWSTEEDNV